MTEYQSDPEYPAILETVIVCARDDAPRLILSDWLEDHGEDARAKYIRDALRFSDPRDCGDVARERGTLFLGPYDPVRLVPAGQCFSARGFPLFIKWTADMWAKWGGEIMRSHPIEGLELKGEAPPVLRAG